MARDFAAERVERNTQSKCQEAQCGAMQTRQTQALLSNSTGLFEQDEKGNGEHLESCEVSTKETIINFTTQPPS